MNAPQNIAIVLECCELTDKTWQIYYKKSSKSGKTESTIRVADVVGDTDEEAKKRAETIVERFNAFETGAVKELIGVARETHGQIKYATEILGNASLPEEAKTADAALCDAEEELENALKPFIEEKTDVAEVESEVQS